MNLGHPAIRWPLKALIVATFLALIVPAFIAFLASAILEEALDKLGDIDSGIDTQARNRRQNRNAEKQRIQT